MQNLILIKTSNMKHLVDLELNLIHYLHLTRIHIFINPRPRNGLEQDTAFLIWLAFDMRRSMWVESGWG